MTWQPNPDKVIWSKKGRRNFRRDFASNARNALELLSVFASPTGHALLSPFLQKRDPVIANDGLIHAEKRRNVPNAELLTESISSSISFTTGNDVRVFNFKDLKAFLASLQSADDNTEEKISFDKYDLEFRSSYMFQFGAFVVVSESGSTFTPQNSASNTTPMNMRSLISAGIGSVEHKIIPLGFVKSIPSPSSAEYVAGITLDLSKVDKQVLKTAEEVMFTGDDLPDVDLIWCAISTHAQDTITYQGFHTYHSYSINRS
jgi:hypothetical protein